MRKLLLFATVLAVASLGTARAAFGTNYNVGLTDSNTTSDSTTPGSGASQYVCSENPQNFFCTEETFTCYGWSNCSALGATDGAPDLATFLASLDDNSGTGPNPAAAAPEPASLVLLGSGLMLLLARRRRAR